jgi:ATP-dependent Clp protease ATP-binding subunit ClpC
VAAKTLKNHGLTAEKIMALVENNIGRGAPGQEPNQGLTPRAKRIIERGVSEAARLGHGYVGTEHLLMGMLREYDCLGARLIASSGVDLNKVYTDLLSSFGNDINQQPPTFQGSMGPMGPMGPMAAPPKASARRSDTKTLDQFSRDLPMLRPEALLIRSSAETMKYKE